MNVTELIERLRFCETNPGWDELTCREQKDIASALEAQAREIADLQAGWQRTYDHDVARLQERLAAAERELGKRDTSLRATNDRLTFWINRAGNLERERDELIGMREEVLHYQREFHRLRDERDNFFRRLIKTVAERAEAVALLREIAQRDRHWREGGYDVRMYVGDYERIEAFLAADSASGEGEK